MKDFRQLMLEVDWIDDEQDTSDWIDELIKKQRLNDRKRSYYNKPSTPFKQDYKPEPPTEPRYKNYNNTRWLIPNLIIRSARPGYPDEDFQDESIVDEWLDMIKNETGAKPKTIITFLDDLELAEFYNFDLIQAYEDRGIKVYRVPTEDPVFKTTGKQDPVFTFAQYKKIVDLIRDADKPVLIHCSAGIDRTGAVSQYLLNTLQGEKPSAPKPKTPESRIDRYRRMYGTGGESPMATYGD